MNKVIIDLLHNMQLESSPRDMKVKESFLAHLQIDPLFPIMNFHNRKFNWKYFIGELYWYLSGELITEKISKFSSFWKGLEVDGKVNSNYGYILLHRDGHNQLQWIISSLLKDKNTRQALAVFNVPIYQKDNVKDFVCTMYVSFWIRDDKLNMKVQMRSNDIFYGLQYDAPFFSLIHQSVYLSLKDAYCDLTLGTYHHCSDNIHYYERHFDLVDRIKNETDVLDEIELKINKPLFISDGSKCYLSNASNNFLESMNSISDIETVAQNKLIELFKQHYL